MSQVVFLENAILHLNFIISAARGKFWSKIKVARDHNHDEIRRQKSKLNRANFHNQCDESQINFFENAIIQPFIISAARERSGQRPRFLQLGQMPITLTPLLAPPTPQTGNMINYPTLIQYAYKTKYVTDDKVEKYVGRCVMGQ